MFVENLIERAPAKYCQGESEAKQQLSCSSNEEKVENGRFLRSVVKGAMTGNPLTGK